MQVMVTRRMHAIVIETVEFFVEQQAWEKAMAEGLEPSEALESLNKWFKGSEVEIDDIIQVHETEVEVGV